MIVFNILFFGFRLAGELASSFPCCLVFFNAISFGKLHLRDGVIWMPRYVYGACCVRIGKPFALYVMFCDWMNALNVLGLNLDLLGHFVMAHLDRLRSICAHSTNF